MSKPSLCICLCRPAEIPPSEAVSSLNASYLGANEGALNMTRTSSANLSRLRGKATKQFVLRPGQLDFGSVRLGQVSLAGCMLELPVFCWQSGSTDHENKGLHDICKIPVRLQRTLQQANWQWDLHLLHCTCLPFAVYCPPSRPQV